MSSLASKLSSANETSWIKLGQLAEILQEADKAMYSYENALRHNPYNVKALTQIASICRLREQYPKSVEYFQRILNIDNNNGEIWGALGHCYLMMDDLQKAYTAYQQALYHLPNPKDPNLWYGIGILYDRYGSFEHAEEAFTAVLKMDPKFEKSNEIYFRLGIIYKQQTKLDKALECFRSILSKPPRPLGLGDIWFQIGHICELQKDVISAKEAYETVLKETPNHPKALQQLGWLYHSNKTIGNLDITKTQEKAITYLMRSIEAEPTDGQSWYLLGRCYMSQQQYRKAYDAYQQAVYRDGRNPTFWCSIGVLYFQINQYRDALDAYSRAIRLNPYLSEVWYDLGTLYEACNQIQDSLDAYQRAAELDPGNKDIQRRLSVLHSNQKSDPEVKDSELIPKTLEPRAVHIVGDLPRGSSRPNTNPQNIPTVPDLVDLSGSSEKRTLPSANDLPQEKPIKDSPSPSPSSHSHSFHSQSSNASISSLTHPPFHKTSINIIDSQSSNNNNNSSSVPIHIPSSSTHEKLTENSKTLPPPPNEIPILNSNSSSLPTPDLNSNRSGRSNPPMSPPRVDSRSSSPVTEVEQKSSNANTNNPPTNNTTPTVSNITNATNVPADVTQTNLPSPSPSLSSKPSKEKIDDDENEMEIAEDPEDIKSPKGQGETLSPSNTSNPSNETNTTEGEKSKKTESKKDKSKKREREESDEEKEEKEEREEKKQKKEE